MSRAPLAILATLLVLGACRGGDPDVVDQVEGALVTTPPLRMLGKVVDGSGRPVPGAVISTGEFAVTSAPDGWFELDTKSPGEVAISKPGWVGSEVDWDGSSTFTQVAIEPRRLRGLRVAASAAGDDDEFAAILSLAEATAINALVFDTKQEGGKVLYDTTVASAHDWGAAVSAYDPAERITQAKEAGLYLITRIVTFEDWFWAEARPDQVLVSPWINPAILSTWEYPLALAEEACALGFDEIQFDYVRFPSGETVEGSGQMDMTQAERVGAIEGFLEAGRELLHPMGCAISADVFGIVLAAENDQGIGQRPEELTRHLDAFSPMVYPSHYSDGWLGLEEPNDHPYDVTRQAIEDGLERIQPGVVLRPWLQAFWWTDDQIRRSVQAAEDSGVGWFLWNAVSKFSRQSIPTDAEVNAG